MASSGVLHGNPSCININDVTAATVIRINGKETYICCHLVGGGILWLKWTPMLEESLRQANKIKDEVDLTEEALRREGWTEEKVVEVTEVSHGSGLKNG